MQPTIHRQRVDNFQKTAPIQKVIKSRPRSVNTKKKAVKNLQTLTRKNYGSDISS